MRSRVLFATVVLAALAQVAIAGEAPIWLAVGPEDLLAEIGPLAELRRGEGIDVRLAPPPVGSAIRALPRSPSFLLLVGDDLEEPGPEAWRVPGRRVRQYRWSAFQDPEFVSDTAWGDLDGDMVPDIPVGRIPARTPEEVSAAVAKILSFERRAPVLEDLRILAAAGRTGYGKALDAMATGLLADTLRRFAPPFADRYLLSAQIGHPLCGWPPDQPVAFNREFKRGALLAAFVSHASDRAVALVDFQGKRIRYAVENVRRDLGEGEPGPPMVILACLAGSFAGPRPCLAEELLRLRGGPVAVIAASTESHPITNYYSGKGLLQALASDGRRIGEIWLDAHRRAREMHETLVESALKDPETSVPYEIEVAKLKRDQELMYTLFGDPATRIKLPGTLDATVERTGDRWRWSVERRDGDLELLVYQRPFEGRKRPSIEMPVDREKANARLAEANRRTEFLLASRRGPAQEWTGETGERGWLRLVVRGRDGIRVHVARLR